MSRYEVLITGALLSLLLIYPFFFRHSYSELSHWYFDSIQVNLSILGYVAIAVVLTMALVFTRNRLSLSSLLILILTFSVVGAMTAYPAISDVDVNLEGASVKVIAADGRLSDAWNLYHVYYPGFFVLWATLSVVTGIDIRAMNVMIMLPVSVVLFGAFLVLLYRRLGMERGVALAAGLLAFLLMNFHINEGLFVHFNTRLYALDLTLLALIFFFATGSKAGHKEQLVFVVVFSALVISHVLFSLALLAFVLIYWLTQERRDKSVMVTAFSCVAVYLIHNLVTASRYVGLYINSFINYLYVRLAQEMLITAPLVTENVPFLSFVLRTYYKVLLVAVGLLAAYSLVKFRSKSGVRTMLSFLSAGIAIFGVTVFSAISGNSIARGLMFLSIPLAFLSVYALVGRPRVEATPLRLSVVTLFISLLIIPQFVLVNETSARNLDLPSLDAACTFVTRSKNGQSVSAYGLFPHYFCFYDPKFKGYEVIGYSGEPNLPTVGNLSDITSFFIQSEGMKFTSSLDIQIWALTGQANLSSFDEAKSIWNLEVILPVEQECNKIYENGCARAYH